MKDEKQENLISEEDKKIAKEQLAKETQSSSVHTNDTQINEEVQLINHQAAQSQYVEKLEKLLLKDDITEQDVQNVEFCKAELLSQFLGAVSFSSSLSDSDARKKAADALSSHLEKLYAKTAKLKEKLALKEKETMQQYDIRDTKFNTHSPIITDNMLDSDWKKLAISTSVLASIAISKTPLKDLINNPATRLKAMLPDLLDEFNQKTTPDEKDSFSKWANTLATGLSKLGGTKSIASALQGKNIASLVGKLFDSKNIA